jgi:uncharacterized protein (TIGR02757 family)
MTTLPGRHRSAGAREGRAARPRPVDRAILEALCARFDRRYVRSDPLSFVHAYRAAGAPAADLEIAAFLASALAYGGVKVIRRSLQSLFATIGPEPSRFVRALDPGEGLRLFGGFSHRFHKGRDVALLCWLLRQALERHGTLESLFLEGDDPGAADVGPGLARFVDALLEADVRPFYPRGILPKEAPVRHFLPSPAGGSACKRLCLFLRWMVRRGEPDLGLWLSIAPGRLVVPLDTHVARIGRYLGLTDRRSGGWKAAREVSAGLRRFDPDDPVRFDFALAHLGIHHCLHRPDAKACPACPVQAACSLGSRAT